MNEIIYNWLSFQFSSINIQSVYNAIDEDFVLQYLTHAEEKKNLERDQWGNWDIQLSEKDHREPFLDYYLSSVLTELKLNRVSQWPNSAPMAVIFSHDLDVVSENDPIQIVRRFERIRPVFDSPIDNLKQSIRLLKYKTKSMFSTHNSDVLWCYEKWIDTARNLGMKNTFFIFIMPDSTNIHFFDCDFTLDDLIVYRGVRLTVADFIRTISNEGVEIGLHGSINSHNDSCLFAKLKSELENVVGKDVIVTRQHFLMYDVFKTTQIHSKNGIKVDSTLGYNTGVGFRSATSYPYLLESGVLEVPQIIMDGALFRDNSLKLTEESSHKLITSYFEMVSKVGGCLTFNFHQNYLNIPAYWSAYTWALSEAKRFNAWSASFEEILNLSKKLDCIDK
jgi:hypothetical protein